jgi:superfamily II DNA or RNA helicase
MPIKSYKKIKKITILNNKENCYDLQVKDTHSYIGNGFLNHNTSIFISLIKEMNLPTLLIFNKVSLVEQTYKRMIEAGIKGVGYCHGQGYKPGPIMLSTIGSVYRVQQKEGFQCLIVDEVHHAQSKEYQKFLSENVFPLRFGFSATPEGNKDKYKFALIRSYFGPVIEEITTLELLENSVIAKPIIKFIDSEAPKTMDYPGAYNFGVVLNDERNIKILKLCEKYKLPTLILVRVIEHGDILSKIIPDSYFINGSHSIKEREKAIEDFKKGEIKNLIASNIFNEGISVNEIKMLIIASAGLSDVESVQKIGRSLRLSEDKKEALVFDFNDYGNKFLEKHSTRRKYIYKKLGFEVT